MQTVDEILMRVSKLPPEERRKLADSPEEGLADELAGSPEAAQVPVLERWL